MDETAFETGRKLSIGFSPCPNDTFIFDALVNRKIDTGRLEFDPVMEDVETLNEWAFTGKLDISKLSFSALLQVTGQYRLLNSGSALGKGCGPLLIARKNFSEIREQIPGLRIAIPGLNTTANMLLSFAFPEAARKIPMLFSRIEDSVLNGETDLGLIIHESRFTYAQKGLVKILDLGEYWEEKTGCPIPLGGIAIKKSLDKALQQTIDQLIRKSLEYAFARYPALPPFVTGHAREMGENVMRQHIDLYVNDYSLDLGPEGKKAISILAENSSLPPDPAVAAEEMYVEK